MKIATLLPLTENYTVDSAGAASLAVYDNFKYSCFKGTIFGNTNYRKYLSSNYKNLHFKKKYFFLSRNKEYLKTFLTHLNTNKFSIIEIYNRPEFVHYLKKRTNLKLILHIINDPLKLRGSKTLSDRINLINFCEIIFISKWTKKQFFKDFPQKKIKKSYVIPPGTTKPKKFPKKKKIIIFAGKTNKSKGFDIFCSSVINVLNNFSDWKAIVIGQDPREVFNYCHPRLLFKGWLSHKLTLLNLSRASICVVPSRWEEPFGRISQESSAFGCANIISNRGGLLETCKYRILLKDLTANELSLKISRLLKNSDKLKWLQKNSYKSHYNTPENSVFLLDKIRKKILTD
jgi:glycosyltransferase involved in cell wall biosynthesis